MTWSVIALGFGLFMLVALSLWALFDAYSRRGEPQEAIVE